MGRTSCGSRLFLWAGLCAAVIAATGIAAVLFGRYVMGPGRTTREILVTEAHLEALRQDHSRRTGSLPTEEEEKRLIARYIDEEVLVREAMRMGMDQGDPIVRRRLVQKMESLMEEFYGKAEPGEAEVREYFEAHKERFLEQPRVSLTHVFLGRGADTETAEGSSVKAVLEKLRAGADPRTVGMPFPLGNSLEQRTHRELEGMFGDSFAKSVAGLPQGVWHGPVESSYGVHIVRVDSRSPARQKGLEEVRERVVKELTTQRLEAGKRSELSRLRKQYRIRWVGSEGKVLDQ